MFQHLLIYTLYILEIGRIFIVVSQTPQKKDYLFWIENFNAHMGKETLQTSVTLTQRMTERTLHSIFNLLIIVITPVILKTFLLDNLPIIIIIRESIAKKKSRSFGHFPYKGGAQPHNPPPHPHPPKCP